jgi:hypothetical protein
MAEVVGVVTKKPDVNPLVPDDDVPFIIYPLVLSQELVPGPINPPPLPNPWDPPPEDPDPPANGS